MTDDTILRGWLRPRWVLFRTLRTLIPPAAAFVFGGFVIVHGRPMDATPVIVALPYAVGGALVVIRDLWRWRQFESPFLVVSSAGVHTKGGSFSWYKSVERRELRSVAWWPFYRQVRFELHGKGAVNVPFNALQFDLPFPDGPSLVCWLADKLEVESAVITNWRDPNRRRPLVAQR